MQPPKTTNTKQFLLATIREAECIGCTKCIQACPADAILGSAALMHTVIVDECIGCQLCVAPCPVDCIDMVPVGGVDKDKRRQMADNFRKRYVVREARLGKEKEVQTDNNVIDEKRAYVIAALERVRLKNKRKVAIVSPPS